MNNYETDTFPHNNKKYRCFCGKIHVKDGAQAAGVFLFLMILISIASELYKLTYMPANAERLFSIFIFGIQIIPIAIMMYGITKMKKHFLIPQLIIMLLQEAIMLLAFLIIFFITLGKVKGDSPVETEYLLGICAFGVILYAWFIYIIIRCYGYIKDYDNYIRQKNDISMGRH